jgi:phenylacetate-CoA ligase
VIRQRQWQALRSLLDHAFESVPFYRDCFQSLGLRPVDLSSWDDFAALPVLTKADIREHKEELVSSRYARQSLFSKKTSGSVGIALEVLIDQPSRQWKRACTLRSDEWSGWRFGESVAAVWGNPDYLKRGWRGRFRNAVLERARYLDSLNVDEAGLRAFVNDLNRRPPSLIFGHAHSVYLLAEFARHEPHVKIRPRGIITTAMVLHQWEREAIEEAFACPVTNRYGCEEVSLIACECEKHSGLHVNSDGVYVEIIRDGRPAKPGEAGSVIVTDLTNRGMPIIRYQVGDVAVASEGRCPCGRGLPLLERLEGREADYIVTRQGKLVSGISLTENFAYLIPGAAQMQIVQETLDSFRFRIVRGPEFAPASLDRLREQVAVHFGPQASFECEYVDRIPQEPSGKYRFCVSKVPNPFVRAREAVPT